MHGVSGLQNGNTVFRNCYRYENQIFYRRDGTTVYTTPTDLGGTVCTLIQLNSVSFYTDDLGWDADVWNFSELDFANGKYPTFKKT